VTYAVAWKTDGSELGTSWGLPGDRPAPKVLQIATFGGARVMKHDYDRGWQTRSPDPGGQRPDREDFRHRRVMTVIKDGNGTPRRSTCLAIKGLQVGARTPPSSFRATTLATTFD
jgi:hypothetical protein